MYESYPPDALLPTRHIWFADFADIPELPLLEVFSSTGLKDIWDVRAQRISSFDLLRQFYANRVIVPHGVGVKLRTRVQGISFTVSRELLHQLFHLPYSSIQLGDIVMSDPILLSRIMLDPPPTLLDRAPHYSRMTYMARLATSIFSWDLEPKKGGHATPVLRDMIPVYALLGGIKLSWADVLLENMCYTTHLPHTSEVMHILDHFHVDRTGVVLSQKKTTAYTRGSAKKMFPSLIRISSAAYTTTVPPASSASQSVSLPAPTASLSTPPGLFTDYSTYVSTSAIPTLSIPTSSVPSFQSFVHRDPGPSGPPRPVFTKTPSFVHTDFASILPHPDCRAPHTPLIHPHHSCPATHFPTPPPAPTPVEEQLQVLSARLTSWQDFMYSYLRGMRQTIDDQFLSPVPAAAYSAWSSLHSSCHTIALSPISTSI